MEQGSVVALPPSISIFEVHMTWDVRTAQWRRDERFDVHPAGVLVPCLVYERAHPIRQRQQGESMHASATKHNMCLHLYLSTSNRILRGATKHNMCYTL